jgi:hypothetical protein
MQESSDNKKGKKFKARSRKSCDGSKKGESDNDPAPLPEYDHHEDYDRDRPKDSSGSERVVNLDEDPYVSDIWHPNLQPNENEFQPQQREMIDGPLAVSRDNFKGLCRKVLTINTKLRKKN